MNELNFGFVYSYRISVLHFYHPERDDSLSNQYTECKSLINLING